MRRLACGLLKFFSRRARLRASTAGSVRKVRSSLGFNVFYTALLLVVEIGVFLTTDIPWIRWVAVLGVVLVVVAFVANERRRRRNRRRLD